MTRLDTLELTVPKSDKNYIDSSAIKYMKRQRAKAQTKSINGKLLYLGSDRHKDYQKAFYCSEYLFQNGKKVTSILCRKRSCNVCSRIKAAELFVGYSEQLLSLPDLHLVTLTASNVKLDQLDEELTDFAAIWRAIYRKIKKVKVLQGFKKIEITYSSKRDDFNPHFHILISGADNARMIVDEWLKRKDNTSEKGQDIRKVESQNALIEVFKYVTKSIIKDTFDSRSLDAMYRSIHNRRVYSAFGIKKDKKVKVSEESNSIVTHRSSRIEVWKWCNDEHDWYAPSGESFNDTKIDRKTLKLIDVVNKSKIHVYSKKEEEVYDGPSFDEIVQRHRDRGEVLF